jgi:hypothetical protein
MKRLFVALCLAVLGFTAAPAPADPFALMAIGTVVSRSQDKLVIRTDDHGHRISFDLATAAVVPEGVRAGSRVRVDYTATGSTGQRADKVTVVEGRPTRR